VHLRPFTEGKGSRAGMRSLEGGPFDIETLGPVAGEFREDCLATWSGVWYVDISGFAATGAEELGDSLEALGVRLEVGRRDEAAVAAVPWRADVLNIDEAALLYELAESTVPGMSVKGDSVSSGCVGIASDAETMPFWLIFASAPITAVPVVGSVRPLIEADTDAVLERSWSLTWSARV
jgi:hypothetical protein